MSLSELSILMQDEAVVVVHKPAGLLVHRSQIDRAAREFALQIVRDQIGAHVFPVHRLDRPTSGALLFAKSAEGARNLSLQFATASVRKSYLAVVRGHPASPEQTIDYALREELDAIGDRDACGTRAAQAAITDIACLARCELDVHVDRYPTSRYALVRAHPRTGRKHQIRRHLRHIGHPIIGDVNHGCGKHNRFFADRFGVRRLFLACTGLEFNHPFSERRVCVKAPLDADWVRVLGALGWAAHV